MRRSIIATAAILLLSVDTSGRAKTPGFDYVSPLPGSTMVSQLTNIILRPSREIPAQSIVDRASIRVTGTRSGEAAGTLILSDDGTTLTFNPARAFAREETVTVEVRSRDGGWGERAGSLLRFSFNTTGYVGRARTVRDEPASAVQAHDTFLSTRSAGLGLPADFPSVTVTHADNPSPGCLFLSNMTMGSGSANSPYIMILDNSGAPVFYRSTRDECTDFKVQPNGLITYMDSYLHCFLALDSSYAVVDTFRCGNGYPTNWHELRILPDGHALILGDDPQVIRMDSVVPGGYPSAVVQGIVIQELDRSKNVVFQWRTFDYFKITDATHEDLTASFIDYVHSNAIEPDTDGTLMLSSRHMDEITKINRRTGDIVWRWGGKNNQFTFVNDSLGFRHQHAIRRLPNGNVTLFDNGDFRYPLLSRGVEYSLDEGTKKAVQVWQYRENPDIYASAMGYVQRLPNGNTLVGWGRRTRRSPRSVLTAASQWS